MIGRIRNLWLVRRLGALALGVWDTFLRDNKTVPAVLAVLALFVFSWVVAGAFAGSSKDRPVANRNLAQSPQEQTTTPPAVVNPNVNSYAAYQSKDPFRPLFSSAGSSTGASATTESSTSSTSTSSGSGSSGTSSNNNSANARPSNGASGGASPDARSSGGGSPRTDNSGSAAGGQYGNNKSSSNSSSGHSSNSSSGQYDNGGDTRNGAGGKSGRGAAHSHSGGLFNSGGNLPVPRYGGGG